ncbi:MAG TPA: hypothetical protein VG652_10280 [Gaiellaceae bacterium]|nr:hypothetical protein [Gaiellaceae bacterium]
MSGIGPRWALSAFRELRGGATSGPIAVAGARELVPLLARELRAGGDASAVHEDGRLDGAEALVWIGAADEDALHAASRAGIPIVAVTDADELPYVLDTDLVRTTPGEGFPVEELARVLARRLGDAAAPLAGRLPVLRHAVVEHLIRHTAHQNGLIGAAVFVPGVDMPILTLNQMRLVARIATAYGHELGRSDALELLGVVGAGFGFRMVAREALDLIPGVGWAVKGAIAMGGTRAVGEAARAYYAARTEE